MTTTTSNPYAAPPAGESFTKGFEKPEFDFGAIIKRWEILRLVYNGVLIPWSIFLLMFSQAMAGIILALPIGGVVANILFFLGPTVEAYMTWFGFWWRPFTYLLFLAGLALTGFMAAVAILQF